MPCRKALWSTAIASALILGASTCLAAPGSEQASVTASARVIDTRRSRAAADQALHILLDGADIGGRERIAAAGLVRLVVVEARRIDIEFIAN